MNFIQKKVEKSRESFNARIQRAAERRQELRDRGEAVLEQGRARIHTLESMMVQQAHELIARANDSLGDRAPILGKGEQALADMVVTLRAEDATTLPLEGFDELSIKKIEPHLEGFNELDLRTLRAYEAKNKNRVTLLRKIDDQIEALADQDHASN
jgi:ElaB/YqjD/DUF883 family membrane-anchored ribosome-binding protein